MGEGGVSRPVLRIIEEQVIQRDVMARETVGVRREKIRNAMLADLDPVRFQRGHGCGDSLRHQTPK